MKLSIIVEVAQPLIWARMSFRHARVTPADSIDSGGATALRDGTQPMEGLLSLGVDVVTPLGVLL